MKTVYNIISFFLYITQSYVYHYNIYLRGRRCPPVRVLTTSVAFRPQAHEPIPISRVIVCPYRLQIAQPVICHLLYAPPSVHDNNNKIVNNSPVVSHICIQHIIYTIIFLLFIYTCETIVIECNTLNTRFSLCINVYAFWYVYINLL